MANRIILVIVLSVLVACTHLLFYPSSTISYPAAIDAYSKESLFITMRDSVQLSAMRIFCRHQCSKGAVLFFHGNANNLSIEVEKMLWLADYGYDVIIVDYRGYGLSSGKTDLDATLLDIEEVINWFLLQDTPYKQKFVIAHSLGAAMTGYVLATQSSLAKAFSGIVLVGGFASYPQIMRDAMNKNGMIAWLRYPASMFMTARYDLEKVISDISPVPLLIIHGQLDPVVPYHHAEQLYWHASEPKMLLSYKGLHNDAFESDERKQWVLDFFAKLAN